MVYMAKKKIVKKKTGKKGGAFKTFIGNK